MQELQESFGAVHDWTGHTIGAGWRVARDRTRLASRDGSNLLQAWLALPGRVARPTRPSPAPMTVRSPAISQTPIQFGRALGRACQESGDFRAWVGIVYGYHRVGRHGSRRDGCRCRRNTATWAECSAAINDRPRSGRSSTGAGPGTGGRRGPGFGQEIRDAQLPSGLPYIRQGLVV